MTDAIIDLGWAEPGGTIKIVDGFAPGGVGLHFSQEIVDKLNECSSGEGAVWFFSAHQTKELASALSKRPGAHAQ